MRIGHDRAVTNCWLPIHNKKIRNILYLEPLLCYAPSTHTLTPHHRCGETGKKVGPFHKTSNSWDSSTVELLRVTATSLLLLLWQRVLLSDSLVHVRRPLLAASCVAVSSLSTNSWRAGIRSNAFEILLHSTSSAMEHLAPSSVGTEALACLCSIHMVGMCLPMHQPSPGFLA